MLRRPQAYLTLVSINLVFLLVGCSSPKLIFNKDGLTQSEFNSDKYDCTQQSRVTWSGGGTGGVGLAMILSSKSAADKQASDLFKMCMEARGYTWKEVDNAEFERQTKNPLTPHLTPITKNLNMLCERSDFKSIYAKSSCKADFITLAQLTDTSIITEAEKKIFSPYRSEVRALLQQQDDAIATYGGPKDKELGLVMLNLHQQSDENALELYDGRKSWGEYNKSRKASYERFKEERNRILSSK